MYLTFCVWDVGCKSIACFWDDLSWLELSSNGQVGELLNGDAADIATVGASYSFCPAVPDTTLTTIGHVR